MDLSQINPLAFMELFVVLAFVVGWIVLEKVASRYDKPTDATKPDPADTTARHRPADQDTAD